MSNSNNILRKKQIHIEGKLSFSISDDGEVVSNIPEKLIKEKEDIERKIVEAKEEYDNISKKTSLEIEKILNEANIEAKDIERKAYQKNIDKAIKESKAIKDEGYKTLLQIRNEAADYIKESKNNILQVSIEIAEQVLREKFEDTDTMNKLLENVIKEYSLKKDMVIKINPTYINQLQISDIKNKLDLTQRVFVICDSDIEKGNVEIETGSGKLIVGIDGVLEKIRSELL